MSQSEDIMSKDMDLDEIKEYKQYEKIVNDSNIQEKKKILDIIAGFFFRSARPTEGGNIIQKRSSRRKRKTKRSRKHHKK